MQRKEKMLSESAAEDILNMITADKRFAPGDKLPNENLLSEELKVSRTTLREAIKILTATEVLEVQRGKGTFVKENLDIKDNLGMDRIVDYKINARDLYEMRLIFEPEAAYYAALRANDRELQHIVDYGIIIEENIRKGEDRTISEKEFHKAIARATHNEFMNKLMPILYQAIGKGVVLSEHNEQAVEDTLHDHRMIVDFLKKKDGDGARTAMKLHILHAINELNI
jgi:GntR family transcriptional regulator, transcriptional repressor for pyruvate dehydrogenase complex